MDDVLEPMPEAPQRHKFADMPDLGCAPIAAACNGVVHMSLRLLQLRLVGGPNAPDDTLCHRMLQSARDVLECAGMYLGHECQAGLATISGQPVNILTLNTMTDLNASATQARRDLLEMRAVLDELALQCGLHQPSVR